MQFSISLSDLERLTGAAGITAQSGEALDARLKKIFAFLPEDTDFSFDSAGILHVEVPEPGSDNKRSAERHAEKAARLAKNGDFSKAKQSFLKALELDPTLTTARRDLAMLYSEIGEHEAAKDHLIDVLRVTPGDAWAYVILANHYSKAEDNPKMAATLLERAVEIAPTDPYVHNSLAAAFLEQGRKEEALQHFALALKSNPRFANAYYGRAMVYVQQKDFPNAELTLEELFKNADLQDSRAAGMLREARSVFLKTENIIANDRQTESQQAVDLLRRQTEEVSGYPVTDTAADLPQHIGGKIRMAWKHNLDHHQLILRGGDYPEILKHHLIAHELYHIILESAARQRHENRWFTAGDRHRFVARETLSKPLDSLTQKGFGPSQLQQLFTQLFDGITNLLYNCAIDMRIERKIRENHPELKQAQFCGIAQLCHEARNGTLAPRVRETFPAAVLRYNDALNVAYALFVDDLFHGATANAEAFQGLPAFVQGRKLYQMWQSMDRELPDGDEWKMVDGFAEELGLTDWYAWHYDNVSDSGASDT